MLTVVAAGAVWKLCTDVTPAHIGYHPLCCRPTRPPQRKLAVFFVQLGLELIWSLCLRDADAMCGTEIASVQTRRRAGATTAPESEWKGSIACAVLRGCHAVLSSAFAMPYRPTRPLCHVRYRHTLPSEMCTHLLCHARYWHTTHAAVSPPTLSASPTQKNTAPTNSPSLCIRHSVSFWITMSGLTHSTPLGAGHGGEGSPFYRPPAFVVLERSDGWGGGAGAKGSPRRLALLSVHLKSGGKAETVCAFSMLFWWDVRLFCVVFQSARSCWCWC